MDATLFDAVSDGLRGLVPAELGVLYQRPHRYGIKVWLAADAGNPTPPREHYEAQVLGARHVPGATTLAVEIGFHAEYPKVADNDAALAPFLSQERRWRKVLGAEPVAGAFLGRETWRRISETWADPDLSEPEIGIEIAVRLTDYITALEPLRSRRR